MPRLAPVDPSSHELQPLVERIVAQRGQVLDLYAMLLHSPPVAQGWLSLLTAIRQQANLPGRLRELVILRIAVLNRAPYEHAQHVPYGRREGLSQAAIDAIADWQASAQFSDVERAVLNYADAMTLSVQVPDDVYSAVASRLPERDLVELTATVAAYNMVSRFLEALELRP